MDFSFPRFIHLGWIKQRQGIVMKKVLAALCLFGTLLITGCFDTKQEFTLNPDGSGKVVQDSAFQRMNLKSEGQNSDEQLREAVRSILNEAKGVEAWKDLSFKRLPDGRMAIHFTAYFKDV